MTVLSVSRYKRFAKPASSNLRQIIYHGLPGIVVPALISVSALLPVPATAQNEPLIAYVSANGSVNVRSGDGENALLTIQPGLFEQTWQYRGIGNGVGYGSANPGIVAEGKINAPTASATVAVRTTILPEGDRLRVQCTFTPDKAVPVNSLHVSINAPVSLYRGAVWMAGNQQGTVPATAKDVHLVGGVMDTLTLGNDPQKITVSGPNAPILLQDGRVFGGGDLELRVGQQSERTLAAGTPETIQFTLTLPGKVVLMKEEPLTLRAGADWIPLDLKLDIASGSALDFSNLFDTKPAGTDGRIIVKGGHFAFEKTGKPVRFYGANLCFGANYLDKATADRLADRFVRLGYNTVRIHHYEGELVGNEGPDSLTFNNEKLDQLDYLLAAFKKRGIYIKTDLYVSRPVKPDEMEGMNDFKAAVLVSPKAMANWKEFSRRLLTHVNPYTGLAYKDDPALAFLSVVNEPNATNYFGGLSGPLKERFQAEWDTWRKATSRPPAPMPSAINETSPEGREAGAFVAFLHTRAFHEMKTFLREDIGTKALLTDLNGWSETPAFMVSRTDFDWVDNHFYWDHPSFLERDWQLPSGSWNNGRSAVNEGGTGPNLFAMTRLLDKPFSISEFNYASPNRYRAEGGLLMGAGGALQDWDAIWRFAYSHSREAIAEAQPLNYFDVATDPAGQAGDRAAVLLFRRGDVQPAKNVVARVLAPAPLTAPGANADPVPTFADLTLVTRVGTTIGEEKSGQTSSHLALTQGDSAAALAQLKKAGRVPANNRTDVTRPVRESETGEVLVQGEEGLFQVTTPRTTGAIVPVGKTLTAGPLTVTPQETRGTVWASSLDNKPIPESKRVLLVHLTDIQNSDMRYRSPNRRVLEAWGGLPHLVRRGTAKVVLQRKGKERMQAWRLDTAGNRVAPLVVEQNGSTVTLNLSTVGPDGKATLYYELATR